MINIMNRREIVIKIQLAFIASLILAFLCAYFLPSKIWTLNSGININGSKVLFYRTLLLTILIFFASLNFIFSPKSIFYFLFKYRWILGIGLLLFLTIFKINGDSMGYYSMTIQGDRVNELSYPIFGKIRSIRSDEFLVNNPSIIASVIDFNPFAKYNTLLRGTSTLNIVYGVYASISMLALAPWKLIFTILPLENAFSFYFYFVPIFTFLFCLELFYILSKSKSLATMGAILIVFSPFFLWWGFPTYFLSGSATLVSFYKFIDEHQSFKQILFGILMAINFSLFICNLYPAWQVPLGFVYLVIGIWMIKENFEKIRKFSKKQWVIITISFLFCAFLVIAYLNSAKDYLNIINNTVYPGKRVDNGGNSVSKLLCFAQSIFFPFKDVVNNSDSATFFCLFPLISLYSLYCLFLSKKKDFLIILLIIVEIPMLFYITIGLPTFVSKILLFSHSTSIRMSDIVGYIQIIILVRLLAVYGEEIKLRKNVGLIVATIYSLFSVIICKLSYPEYLNKYLLFLLFVYLTVLIFFLITNFKFKGIRFFVILISVISVVSGICVRPVSVGLSSIYSKPAAETIKKIVSQDREGKWITLGGIETPSYTVMCGASTLNFVNTYPNLKLWHKLDPKHKYENIYNRYEHIRLLLTDNETSFELIQNDLIQLNLSYKDLKKLDVSYIFANGDYNLNFQNGYVQFEKIYDESGVNIFKIKFTS